MASRLRIALSAECAQDAATGAPSRLDFDTGVRTTGLVMSESALLRLVDDEPAQGLIQINAANFPSAFITFIILVFELVPGGTRGVIAKTAIVSGVGSTSVPLPPHEVTTASPKAFAIMNIDPASYTSASGLKYISAQLVEGDPVYVRYIARFGA